MRRLLLGLLALLALATPALAASEKPLVIIAGRTQVIPVGDTLNLTLNPLTTNITGVIQCVQASSAGILSGTGSACGTGSGSGTVTSVACGTGLSGGTITTTGTCSITAPVTVALGGTNATSASGTALDNISGFASTGFLTRTGAGAYSFQSLTNGISLGNIAQIAANTTLGNATGSTANIVAQSMPSCSAASSALTWTTSSGFGCNTISGGGTAANPTATAGPTAINGAASTYMRSDAAPAVQLGSASQAGLLQCDGTSTTCTAGVISSVAGGGASAGASSPQGRLTLVTATPVLISDQTAKSTVYYDCFHGKSVPYYNGTSDQVDPIGGCEVSMTMATSSTGVTNSGGVFDVFWVHSGANRICVVTNGSGGGWASDTAGSNTARGTGYSAVHNTRGYWTNTNSLTHCYNGSTDYGSVSADQATYLGTLTTTAAGQTGMSFQPAAASGGPATAPVLGLWNAYNRVTVQSIARDSKATWTPPNTGWRAADGSNLNRVTWVDGLAHSTAQCIYSVTANGQTGAAAIGAGCDLDSTSANPQLAGIQVNSSQLNISIEEAFLPQIGLHFAQAMEYAVGGVGITMSGNPTGALQTMQLLLSIEM